MTTTTDPDDGQPQRRTSRVRPSTAEAGRGQLARAICEALGLDGDVRLGVPELVRRVTEAGAELAELRAEHNLMQQARDTIAQLQSDLAEARHQLAAVDAARCNGLLTDGDLDLLLDCPDEHVTALAQRLARKP